MEEFSAGWGLASSPQASFLNLRFKNFNPYQFCSRSVGSILSPNGMS